MLVHSAFICPSKQSRAFRQKRYISSFSAEANADPPSQSEYHRAHRTLSAENGNATQGLIKPEEATAF